MNKSTIAIIGLALCANMSLAADEQECNVNIIKTTPTANFVINTDGTVTHNTTGLMWKQCSEGLSGANCEKDKATKFTWAGALNHVDDLNSKGGFAGYKDWRVPNIKELDSIVELSCDNPAINAIVFPNTMSARYWSASPNVVSLGAWLVSFSGGYVNKRDTNTSDSLFIRLVRTK